MKFTLVFALAAIYGCGKSQDDTSETNTTDTGTNTTDSATTTDSGTVTTETGTTDTALYPVYPYSVDATSHDGWVYLDLETMSLVEPGTPENSTEWDLAFKRSDIAVNGGVSGSGGVEVAAFPEYWDKFEDYTYAPPHGFATDEAGEDGETAYVMAEWYDYDPSTHTLSAADMLYFVQSVEGNYYRLRFIGYYDSEGTSGNVSFEFGPVDG